MSQQKQAEYAMELKLTAVLRVRAGESERAVAEALGIRRKRLYVWKDRYAELGEGADGSGVECTPKVRQAIKGPATLNGGEQCWCPDKSIRVN
jgi:hypothetical protein